MFKRGHLLVIAFLVLDKMGRIDSVLTPTSSTNDSQAKSSGLNSEELPQCRNADKKLLTNLYLDYFRSSGSCVASEGEVLQTFRDSKHIDNLTEEEETILIEELCKKSPSGCRISDERRSGRLFFGVGKLLVNNFQRKLQRIGDLLTGKLPFYSDQAYSPYYGSYPFQSYTSQSDAIKPSVSSWSSNLPQGPPLVPYPMASPLIYQQQPSPPAPPRPILSSIPHAAYGPPMPFPQLFGYPQPQPQNLFSNMYSQPAPPAYDDPCAGNGCHHPNTHDSASKKPSSRSRHTITKRSICDVETDVIFPMVGKAALDDSTINILQDFPNLLQPVYYRRCRNPASDSMSSIKCLQEFLPMNFFIASSNYSTSESILPQEFVLVESGCRSL